MLFYAGLFFLPASDYKSAPEAIMHPFGIVFGTRKDRKALKFELYPSVLQILCISSLLDIAAETLYYYLLV